MLSMELVFSGVNLQIPGVERWMTAACHYLQAERSVVKPNLRAVKGDECGEQGLVDLLF